MVFFRHSFHRYLLATFALLFALLGVGAAVQSLRIPLEFSFTTFKALFSPVLPLALPTVALGAPLIAAVQMRRQGLILALQSSGVAPKGLLPSGVFLGVLLSLFTIWSVEELAPAGHLASREQLAQGLAQNMLNTLSPGKLANPAPGILLLKWQAGEPAKARLLGILGTSSPPEWLLTDWPTIAQKSLHLQNLSWQMNSPSTKRRLLGRVPPSTQLNLPELQLPLSSLIPQKTRGPEALSRQELEKRIDKMRSDGKAANGELTALHRRWSTPLLCLVLPIFALPLGLGIANDRRALLSGLAALAALILLTRLGDVLGGQGLLSPPVAASLPCLSCILALGPLWLRLGRAQGRPVQ